MTESDAVADTAVEDLPRITRVLVGVDGSAGSRHALRWALREAQAHGVGVHAVFAWHYHETWTDSGQGALFQPGYGLGPLRRPAGSDRPAESSGIDAEATAMNMLEAAVAAAGRGREPAPSRSDVSIEVIEGHPAKVLLGAATGSDLLVVGSRGYGEFAGALLGSISHHVVTHAPCPVVVVPEPRHPDASGEHPPPVE